MCTSWERLPAHLCRFYGRRTLAHYAIIYLWGIYQAVNCVMLSREWYATPSRFFGTAIPRRTICGGAGIKASQPPSSPSPAPLASCRAVIQLLSNLRKIYAALKMHATVALLTLALGLACLLHTARAHANGLASSMCETFHVVHGSPREDDSKDVKVELLLENGNVTDCFSTQREYLGKDSTR